MELFMKKRLILFFSILIIFTLLGLGGFFYYQKDNLDDLLVMEDTDFDGLPDEYEKKIKTDILSKDTDGDNLSDYLEVTKYKTNPLQNDSDNDGLPDSNWNERREYTVTIQAIVDLRPPFNISSMNDFYQDAKIIENLPDDVTRVEVILYPKAKEIINPGYYSKIDNKYTAPTYTKNFSSSMKTKIEEITLGSSTDIQTTNKILRYISKEMERVKIDKDLGYGSGLPLNFNMYLDKSGEIVESDYSKTTKYSIKEIKKRLLFANSMFHFKTYGACGSKSIIRGGMIRAAGIPEKTIATIPLVYWYKTDGTIINIPDKYISDSNKVNIGENSTKMADHFFNLVLIGNRWLRVDSIIKNTAEVVGILPYIKIFDSDDILNYNFTKYWRFDTWRQKRPYKYVSIIQKEPKFSKSK